MSKEHFKQLKSPDPEIRKSAIKALARAREKAAIVPLAKLGGDDRDPEVRELALKAGRFILEQTGGMDDSKRKAPQSAPATPPPPDKSGKAPKFHVSPEDEKRAQRLLDEAMSYQLNDDKAKMMKALSKALSTDPNLRYDSYFASLCEGATGLEVAEAVKMLNNEDMQKNASKKVLDARKQKKIDSHQAEVSKATWRDVALDISVFSIIIVIGVIFVGFIAVQGAQGYLDRYEKNLIDWANRQCVFEDGKETCRLPITQAQIDAKEKFGTQIKLMEVDPTFMETATTISETPVVTIILRGLGAGVVSGLLLLLMSAIIHLISASALGGAGNLPYIAHKAAALMTNRSIIMLVLAGIFGLLILSSGGGNALTIGAAVIGLFTLTVLLKLVGLVGSAYDFGFAKGLVATLIGVIVIGMISGAAGVLVL